MVLFSWTLLPCDSRGSLNFQMAQSKLPDFFPKCQLVIIGADQILKSHEQNSFIFEQVLPRDNWGSANFQVNS